MRDPQYLYYFTEFILAFFKKMIFILVHSWKAYQSNLSAYCLSFSTLVSGKKFNRDPKK